MHSHHIAQAELSLDKVKRNAKGGVLVTSEEAQVAFNMLDIEKGGVITLATLKKRLGVLFPDMSAKDYRFLMNNKKEMNLDDLKELLIDNEITHFDPLVGAFKAFDTDQTGAVNENLLRAAFISFGLGELSDEELDILKRTADLDGDGRITLEDFRMLLEIHGTGGGAASKNSLAPT
jgi:calmodulin